MNTTFIAAGLVLFAALASSAPADCEFPCALDLMPVCGSDGYTYNSECDLKRVDCVRRGLEKLTVAYTGECVADTAQGACEFPCSYSLTPVCGSDGYTYPDECSLKKVDCLRRGVEPLTVAYEGECNE